MASTHDVLVPLALQLYPSSFKLQVCWLRSITRITYLCKLIGMFSLAAFLYLKSIGLEQPKK
ncbi:hypothetical protein CRN75_04545 [Yersinia frederiksenii]|nr:hypothetical protein CRN75_04545 [Yersinia frederiksenii]